MTSRYMIHGFHLMGFAGCWESALDTPISKDTQTNYIFCRGSHFRKSLVLFGVLCEILGQEFGLSQDAWFTS